MNHIFSSDPLTSCLVSSILPGDFPALQSWPLAKPSHTPSKQPVLANCSLPCGNLSDFSFLPFFLRPQARVLPRVTTLFSALLIHTAASVSSEQEPVLTGPCVAQRPQKKLFHSTQQHQWCPGDSQLQQFNGAPACVFSHPQSRIPRLPTVQRPPDGSVGVTCSQTPCVRPVALPQSDTGLHFLPHNKYVDKQ